MRSAIRADAAALPESGIAEVFAHGLGRSDLLKLWVGEGDVASPPAAIEALTRSLAAGETFYTAQRGHPEFRAAIAAYVARTYEDAPAAAWSAVPERMFATIGGMHALQLALRLVAGPGDDVVVLAPAWPNFAGAAHVAGARPIEVPLALERANGWRWRLDRDRLIDAITPRTRALIVNTPANPTGWTASCDDLSAILNVARARGLWIVADEIYGRFVYDAPRAPSFRDVMAREDRILFIQTMSKNWAMTGWRVGWLEAPADLGSTIENLVQYSTSGVPLFAQRGAISALTHGEETFRTLHARAAQSRDVLARGLSQHPRVRLGAPDGAFYLFFAVEGCDDTRTAALQLVDEAGLGLAPGSAFGPHGAGFFRLCFARAPADIAEAVRRLRRWLGG